MPPTAAALPQIAFSRNEINLEITSDDYIAVAGVKSVVHIVFKDAIAADQEIRLQWAGGDITLKAAVTPDSSGTQFATGDGGTAYVTALVPVFADNFYISRDFVVTYGDLIGGFPAIVLTAKNTGVIYNIVEEDYPDVVSVEQATAGVTEQLQPNFAHHVQIWLKRESVFENIYQANLQLDFPFTGLTRKNISDLMHPYLVKGPINNYASDRPSLSASGWEICNSTLLEYYCRYGQYFGDVPEVKKLITTDVGFINVGGLDTVTAPEKSLITYLRPSGNDSAVLCLRQGSKTLAVQPEQPEYLYWINLTGENKDIKLRLEVVFSDGSGSQVYQILPQTALAGRKYRVAVGFDQLNITALLPTGKGCSSYTVRVISAAGALLSTTYTYSIDVKREFPRYFIYRNSIGGFQTLYTWGKGQAETTRKKEDVKRLATSLQAAHTGTAVETDIRIQRKQTVYTGYRSRRDIVLLDDFLLSDEKYLVYNGRLIPVGISTDSLKQAPDGENLNGAAFEFYPLYDEVVFTDDTSAPDNTLPDGGTDAAGYNAIIDRGENLDSYYDS